jgi:hypothetical protein
MTGSVKRILSNLRAGEICPKEARRLVEEIDNLSDDQLEEYQEIIEEIEMEQEAMEGVYYYLDEVSEGE